MKNEKLWRLSLPALTASAFVFETMPGSVREFAADVVTTPEVAFNFFTLQSQHRAALCMPLAGGLTVIALGFALAAAFFKKRTAVKMVCWLALAAAALTAMPYMLVTEGLLLQPNVTITLILFAVWLIAWMLDRKSEPAEEKQKKKASRL